MVQGSFLWLVSTGSSPGGTLLFSLAGHELGQGLMVRVLFFNWSALFPGLMVRGSFLLLVSTVSSPGGIEEESHRSKGKCRRYWLADGIFSFVCRTRDL